MTTAPADRAADTAVAATILEQLGGRRFLAMTGAKNLVAGPAGLSFRLPLATKDGSNVVRITLDPSDTYTVETLSIRRRNGEFTHTVKSTVSAVYSDTLIPVFESVTGLAARL